MQNMISNALQAKDWKWKLAWLVIGAALGFSLQVIGEWLYVLYIFG